MNTRAEFQEPYPETPKKMRLPIYILQTKIYKDKCVFDCSLLADDELEDITKSIQQLWSDFGNDTNVYFRVSVEDEEIYIYCMRDGKNIPFPRDWLDKKLVFGKNKELYLVGDRLPIQNWEVQFIDADDY